MMSQKLADDSPTVDDRYGAHRCYSHGDGFVGQWQVPLSTVPMVTTTAPSAEPCCRDRTQASDRPSGLPVHLGARAIQHALGALPRSSVCDWREDPWLSRALPGGTAAARHGDRAPVMGDAL
jgi:hypothetical protein